MNGDVKEIEYKIKLAQLDKLRGQLVSKEYVKKQFALYNSLLWHMVDTAIISIASTLSAEYGVPFEQCVNAMRVKFYQIKDSIEGVAKVD